MPTSRISDEAVRKKTGRDWKGWFALLDKAGAKKELALRTAAFRAEPRVCL